MMLVEWLVFSNYHHAVHSGWRRPELVVGSKVMSLGEQVQFVAGQKSKLGGSRVVPPNMPPTLAEMGIDKKTSSLAQRSEVSRY